MACNAREKYVTPLYARKIYSTSTGLGKKNLLRVNHPYLPSKVKWSTPQLRVISKLSLIWAVSNCTILEMVVNIKDLYGNSGKIFNRFFMKYTFPCLLSLFLLGEGLFPERPVVQKTDYQRYIHWIVICLVDSMIQCLNNWGQICWNLSDFL